jgi:sarcosine oxidase subunit alpha
VTRLPRQPGERIDRDAPVGFTFDGKRVEGYAGDTIGSALYADGRRTFSRSFKYHRRRGLIGGAATSAGTDLVAVDGRPGVRASAEPIRAGMRVEHLNAKPGLDFDVMRATDLFGGPFTPVGFYYKTFIRPRRLWPVYEKVLRHAAGLGVLRKHQEDREWRTEYRRRHADVMVVGGGAAGLRAAIAAARLGADVVLAEEDALPGGRLLDEGGHERAAELAAEAREAGVEVLLGAPVLGSFDGLLPVWQGDTLHQVRARQLIFATGTVEQPLVFAGNDLPGVMLSGGARALVARYAVAPGSRAVVVTTSDRGLAAALALRDAGISVAAVADLRPGAAKRPLAAELERAGVEVLAGHTVIEAKGGRALTAAVLAPLGRHDGERTIDCDLLVVSGGEAPAASLALQAGARTEYDPAQGHFALRDLADGAHAAGSLVAAGEPESAELSGELAGLAAAHALGLGDDASAQSEGSARERLAAVPPPAAPAVPPAVSGGDRGKCFVDLDEDVTVKDVRYAIAEGYDSMELSKRYTTVTMGPSQGRFSSLAMARLMAEETGLDLGTVGQTTARPPWVPVPMGILAGRPIEPAKRSSIHGRHRDLGATVKWAGDWRRAYDYGDPAAEALAVHESAGLIDVSTLGKLVVRGPDAGAFLDRLYPNRLSNLAPGRIRYGVMTSDSGRITDDGTICRLDDETFYVTTTSSGAGAVEEWFGWWLADWKMRVHMTDLTQGLAAVNLAGPRAREIMESLTELDCSAEGFEYLDAKRAPIAGVPCLIMRIGFVGEVGYEIHFPAAHGEYLWDALLEAGAQHGVRPFGLEPQRILRLQKMHILVGQDTDSESTPYDAAMPWIVKLDKEGDFIGRWALEHRAEQDPESRLVGFTMSDGHVPTEGAAILAADGTAAGRVTSSRFSPQLQQVIGMAWVPAGLAADGASITISDNRTTYTADVVTRPFYDPDGEVLRS